MKKTFNIKMTKMPNFLRTERGLVIPVEDLSLEEAQEYAEEMHDAFILHCGSRKQIARGESK